MNQDIFEAKYDVTKKTKTRVFFEKYKIVIYTISAVLILSLFSIFFYTDYKKDKKNLLADKYVEAKIYLENGENQKAINILNEIIQSNDNIYSSLAFFLMLDKNLIDDQKKLSELFESVLSKNNFDKEIRNLIILKKVIFKADFANESEILSDIKPLITSDSVWKPHALLLIGDYFVAKQEYLKSKDFYNQILTMKNLHQDFYYKAKSRLNFISNEKQ